MKRLWNITMDDYLTIVEIARELGLKPGDDMEPIFLEYMKEKGIKSFGGTELTKKELLKEWASKGNSILYIKTDKDGQTDLEIHRENKQE